MNHQAISHCAYMIVILVVLSAGYLVIITGVDSFPTGEQDFYLQCKKCVRKLYTGWVDICTFIQLVG